MKIKRKFSLYQVNKELEECLSNFEELNSVELKAYQLKFTLYSASFQLRRLKTDMTEEHHKIFEPLKDAISIIQARLLASS